jgi:hypothetical protein
MKKIIGFIPSPNKTFGFGIPIYADYDNSWELYFHKLDKESRIIINFENFEGIPVKMLELPTQFHKVLDIGSPAIFAISGKCEIFIGNRDDLKPYYEIIVNKAGKNFAEEFKIIFEI